MRTWWLKESKLCCWLFVKCLYIVLPNLVMLDKDFYLTEFEVPELKKQEVKVQKQLDKKAEDIDKNMSVLFSKRVIPEEVIKRYEKSFGVDKTKRAFRFFFFSCLFVLLFLLFFKPGLLSFYSNGSISVKNFSSSKISNIDVVYLDGYELNNVTTIESIDSLDTKKIQVLKKGVYFVLSYRQLPFIVVV